MTCYFRCVTKRGGAPRRWPQIVLLAAAIAAMALGVRWRYERMVQATIAAASSAAASASAPTPAADRGLPSARHRGGRFAPLILSGGEVAEGDEGKPGAFSGRVVSSGNLKGIAGAHLVFVGPKGAASVDTDQTGEFSFQPPTEGSYELSAATAEGFFPFSPELGTSPIVMVARKGFGVSGVSVHLVPRIKYLGVVKDPSGAAVAGASVRILDDFGAPTSAGGEASVFISGDKGTFEFGARDGAVLEARHQDFSPGRAVLGFSAQVSHRLQIVLKPPGTAPPGASIVGRVVDDEKTPLPDVFVSAMPLGQRFRTDDPAVGAATRTDKDGNFTLKGLAPEKHILRADDGYGNATWLRNIVASARPSPIELVLGVGAVLSGEVVDTNGAPVAAFTILVREKTGALTSALVRVESVFDSAGRFRLSRLPPSQYIATARAAGFATSSEAKVDLTSGDAEVKLSLPRGGSIAGVVRSKEDKNPIEGAKVSLEQTAHRAPGDISAIRAVVTNAQGEFELPGLAPGQHALLIAAAGHHGKIVGALSLREGQRLSSVTVELTPTKEGEKPTIELYGIGAVLSAQDTALVIGKVLPKSGADAAGLVPGDAILAVDEIPISELGFQGAIQRIRGPEGTHANILVRRKATEASEVMLVRRGKIKS